MIKRVIRKIATEVHAEEQPKKIKKVEEKEKKVQKQYVKVVPDIVLSIADKTKLVFSVAQTSQDSPAHVDIRTHVESENYVGPTKKGINFNIEYLDEIISILQSISEDAKDLGV